MHYSLQKYFYNIFFLLI